MNARRPTVRFRGPARRILARAKRAVTRQPPRGPAAGDRFAEPIEPRVATDPPGPTVVLLNDCRDQISFGSNALTDGLIAILVAALPSARILPIPSHWMIDTAHGLGGFANGGEGMRQPRARYPTVADQFESVADDWLEGRAGPGAERFLSRFRSADLVVLNGEGSIYRTNLSAVRELFLAWMCKVRLEIPTVYLNGGMHLTDVVPVLPAMVRKTFRVLDAITIREPCSLRNLEEFVPEVDARLVPDAAFYFSPEDARTSERVRAVQHGLDGAPYFCFDPGSMPMDAREGRGSVLYEMTSALLQIVPRAVFVPMAPADRYVEAVARETEAEYIDSIEDYREFMALASGAEFLVSGRHHNVILAAIVGCPTIPLGAVTHKVHGAGEMLGGLLGPTYDGTDLRGSVDAIAQHARRFRDDRGRYREELLEVTRRRRAEAFELGRIAASALRPPTAGAATPSESETRG